MAQLAMKDEDRMAEDASAQSSDGNSQVSSGKYIQWSSDGQIFVPSKKTVNILPPAAYEIRSNNEVGLYFDKIPVKTEDLIQFPDTESDRVIAEIRTFWKKKAEFKTHKLPYKRGFLLWGPPGCH